MPTFLEGDRKRTLRYARFNMAILSQAVAEGYDIVCSCPTCGYMLKNLCPEGAYYSSVYQASVDAGADILIMPQRGRGDTRLKKAIYGKLFKDDGYFAGLSPMARIAVAEHTFDMGQYLEKRESPERLPFPAKPIRQRMVYFAPCHLREQEIGLPYPELLETVSTQAVESVGGSLYCCGMAGVMGCKQEFHERSLILGRPLAERLETMSPDLVVTDCLSCRLQLRQMTSFPVRHPLEVLAGTAARAASPE
jgi:glycerol-3-phosphate dehydrogenase subunit C